jgi:hypothetical protein
MTDQTPHRERDFALSAPAGLRHRLGQVRSWWWALPVAGTLAVGALFIGMGLAHVVDDDWDFSPGPLQPGQSRAVDITARLVFREVDQNKWVANDPIFNPSWFLDDMPNFQQGIVAASARFARAMADVSDRDQGPDPELERAAGLLKYPGDVWKFDLRASWAPTASSEKQYRNAARNLEGFNTRLSEGSAEFERNTATLQALVAALGQDLAATSAVIDHHLAENHSALFDTQADDVFFRTKGTVYAYALILRETGNDFSQLLANRDLAAPWRQMVESLRAAAALDPVLVLNGSPDGMLLPSHLTAQGFYLLRARAQLTEIAEQLAR